MNRVILMGRLTRDPEIHYTQGEESIAVSRFALAVDRRFKRDGEQSADFINCIAFRKIAELAEKYLTQGRMVTVCGHIQTGSYINKDGVKVYTTDVVIDELEFAGSKGDGDGQAPKSQGSKKQAASAPADDGFMNIPDGVDEELPFN